MNILTRTMAAALLAATPFTMASNAALAVAPGAAVSQLNWHGFQKCKALGRSGWTASARGLLGDGGGGYYSGGFRQFQVRTCFETRSACNRFIQRIHHEVPQIEQLFHATCTSRAG